MNPYLDKFIALGWSFFPLKDGSKKPVLKWEGFLYRKPTDEEIANWKKQNYNNYAVVCGRVSNNLVVLDFESINDAKAFFSGWDKLLEQTLVVATPHGGAHIYLMLEGKVPARQIRIFGDEHPCDLLGEGGYAVAPGSVIECPQGDCNRGARGVYEVISHVEEPALFGDKELENLLAKRARELGWKTTMTAENPEQAERVITGELTQEQVEKIARILSNYWEEGRRNQMTIALCGAFIKNGIGVESAKAVVQRVGELTGDEELKQRLDTVEYEYKPRVLRKERLIGLPTLLEMMKKANPNAEADWQEILAILKPPDKKNTNLAETIAEYLLHEYMIVTMKDSDEIYIRTDGIFENDEALIKKIIQKEFKGEHITIHVVDEVLEHLRRSTYESRSFFEMPVELIPLKNGVLNVVTGEFRPYGENDHFITQIPVEYDPNADAPLFKKFVNEIVYPDDVVLLQEMFGYTLWRGMPAQVAFMLVGEGANGKSTLLTILKAMLGAHNVTSFAIQELENDKFLRGGLYGKLANIRSELPSVALKDTGIFKHLTGGDPITTDVKYGRPFTFVSYAKLIFATNKIPKSPDDTDAFFRRWIIITFPFKFSPNPDPSKGEKKADPELAQKIIKNELPGVLNWALEGLKRLMTNNWKFSNTKTTEETRLDYIRKSDPVRAFFEDAVVVDPNGAVAKAELYHAYTQYCNENKLERVGDVAFFKGLEKLGVDIHNVSFKRVEGKAIRFLKGVTLLPHEKWGKKEEEEENEENAGQQGGENAKLTAEQQEQENKQEQKQTEAKAQASEQKCDLDVPDAMLQNLKPGAGGCYCSICGFGPLDRTTATVHFREKHPYVVSEPETKADAQGEKSDKTEDKTEHAEKKPADIEKLLPQSVLSNLKKEGDRWRCAICGAGPWSDAKTILSHFRLLHEELVKEKQKGSNLPTCPICGARFFSEKELEDHMQIHKEGSAQTGGEPEEQYEGDAFEDEGGEEDEN